MSETCDGCPADAVHFLCDKCCHEEPDAIQREVQRLSAEVADLRARLAYIRRAACTVVEMKRATDLRRKNWRGNK